MLLNFIKMYAHKSIKFNVLFIGLFEDVKMYIRCYLARHLPGSRERICCEKYFDDDEVFYMNLI